MRKKVIDKILSIVRYAMKKTQVSGYDIFTEFSGHANCVYIYCSKT